MTNCKPINIIPNILTEEDIDSVIDQIYNDKHFERSGTELDTYESIEEIKYPQEYEDGGIIILDDINGKKRMILEYMQGLKDIDIITYLFSYSVTITISYQNELSELMEISITSFNQRISEMFKISIKTKNP